ncbi:hypothetical protein HK098_005226 [Nowakowskiella sp. JEL0407]|nr:hypothetical protein HK098_005226 [Nowakowskiella sp. JEL0407]
MGTNDILIQVFGLSAVFFWTIMLAPQVYLNHKSKSTGTLSLLMMTTFPPWAAIFCGYGIAQNLSIPLIIQGYIVGVFGSIIIAQILYFDPRPTKSWGVWWCVVAVVGMCVGIAGGSVGTLYLVKIARESKDPGVYWIFPALGVIPTILIIASFVPQYIKIFQEKTVEGISFYFIGFDITGSVLSIIVLGLSPPPFDFFQVGSFIAIIALQLGIVGLHFWYTGRYVGVKEEIALGRSEALSVAV